MPEYIKLTADDGAAIHIRADQVATVIERPARTGDAVARMIEAAETKLRLAEVESADGHCHCPSPEHIRKEIETLQHERDTGVRGSTVRTDSEYQLMDVRESAERVIALLAGA